MVVPTVVEVDVDSIHKVGNVSVELVSAVLSEVVVVQSVVENFGGVVSDFGGTKSDFVEHDSDFEVTGFEEVDSDVAGVSLSGTDTFVVVGNDPEVVSQGVVW